MKRVVLIAAIAAGASVLLAGCKPGGAGGKAGEAKKPPLVRVVAASRQTISREIEVTGDVVSTNAITVRAVVDGPIAFCPWREGDSVKQGERLVEIDRPLYREEVRSAEAALAVAQARLDDLKAGARPEEIAQAAEAVEQFEECSAFAENDMKRIEQMVKSGSLPGEALEKARVAYVNCATQLEAAREKLKMLQAGPTATAVAVQEALVREAAARLDRARAALSECILTAPFDGIVTRVYVRPGDLATAKAPLLDLMEKDSLVVRAGLPETESAGVSVGASVRISFDALPGQSFGSSVTRVYPELDLKTRTRTIEAKVSQDIGVAPGMFARVAVSVQTERDAVVVPEVAVLTTPRGEKIAFVVNEGKAVMRRVETGLEAGNLVQIVRGIEVGENVIVAGHETLKDGAPVRLPGGAGQEQPEGAKKKKS